MSDSAGSILREARQERGFSLGQVSEKIHIKKRFLKALEAGDFSIMSSQAQLKGFLRSYADFLKLDSKELLSLIFSPASEQPQPTESTQSAEEEPMGPKRESESMYLDIGKTLFERRDLLSLTLDEIEKNIRVPIHYLKLLEEGKFDRFPSPVQARGMLANYASFLNLDSDEIALRLAEVVQSEFAARRELEETMSPEISKKARMALPLWLRNIFSPDLVFVTILGFSMVFFFIWGLNQINSTRSNQLPSPTAPSIGNVLFPTSTAAPSATPPPALIDIDENALATSEAQNQPEIVDVEAALNPDTIKIVLIARQRTWLRVTVDGELAFEGRVATGETLTYTSSDQIEVLTGNAASLQVFYNDRDLGLLGVSGEVVDVIFTRDGLVAPTPTIIPTATATIPVTPTPTGNIPVEQP